MATPIVVGPNYFEAFATGNGVVGGAANYFTYAADHDTNYLTLRNTVNTVIAEVKAITGPNALFGQDAMFLDDATITTPTQTGRIGTNAVVATINGTFDDRIDLSAGAMSLIGIRTDVVIQQVAYGGGVTGTKWLAMDVNGIVSISDTATSALADIYSLAWTTGSPGSFTSVTNLIETMFDGDEWFEMRTEPADTPFNTTASPIQFFGAHTRLDNYSRFLGGYATNSEGDAIGPFIIGGGTAADPRIGLSDGTSTPDANTGLYRSAASELSFSTASTQRLAMGGEGIQVFAGTETDPGIRFLPDTGTGFYRPATNEVAVAIATAESGRWDVSGNFHLDTNARVKGRRTAAQSITHNTATLVDFNAADDFDVGATAWHNHASGTLSDRQEFTVPTNATGSYMIVFFYQWLESTVTMTDSLMEITVGGTALPEVHQIPNWLGGSVSLGGTLTAYAELTAADIVRARVTQIQSTGTAALDLQAAALTIVKVT